MSAPAVITGFVTLDLVYGRTGPRPTYAAGGTAGNVAANLASLGHPSLALSRLGADPAADLVQQDLGSMGVDTRHVRRDPTIGTPIVVEEVLDPRVSGGADHRFSFTHPLTGAPLPRFSSILGADLRHAMNDLSTAPVFFFDRVSPVILRAAERVRRAQGVVIFEPSRLTDPGLFERAVALCDVLKASDARLSRRALTEAARSARVLILTHGSSGITLRVRITERTYERRLAAMPAPRVIDSAGAGDMVTSGLIHVLLQHGMPVLDVPTLETGLRFGQTLAALNCGFVGARGLFAALRQHNPDLMEKVGRSDTLDSDLVALLSPQAGPLLREVDLRSLVS